MEPEHGNAQTCDKKKRAFKEHAAWQELGFLTWEDFCAKRLQVEPDKVETEVIRRAKEPLPLNPPQTHNSFDDYQKTGGGTSADYLTARIARDRPDILDGMKAGKYRSVRQAAIDAGIVTPKTRYNLSDDPEQAGRYLAQRVDQA